MTTEEVDDVIRFLSNAYGVSPPKVRVGEQYFQSAETRRFLCYYNPWTETIYLRPDVLTRECATHEFAHHLQKKLGIPDEHGAVEFERLYAGCTVCGEVFPTPQIGLGSQTFCPYCNSVYEMEDP